MPVRTLGLSPKLLAPVFTALSAVAVSTITTGDLSRPELAVLATALIGAIAAFVAPPGEVATDLEPLDLDEPLTAEEEAELEAIEDVALRGEPVDPRGPGFPIRPEEES